MVAGQGHSDVEAVACRSLSMLKRMTMALQEVATMAVNEALTAMATETMLSW